MGIEPPGIKPQAKKEMKEIKNVYLNEGYLILQCVHTYN